MIEKNFIPDGFREMMTRMLGEPDSAILLSALEGEPDVAIRINACKPPSSELYDGIRPVAWCDSAFYLPSRPNFTGNPLLHAGAFYVQDASSTIYETIVGRLGFGGPVRAADLCAAPGGKTTAMLNALPAGSVMLANEFVAPRANILKENLCKYGYPDVVITNSDTSRLAAMRGYFNLVAIDAPCSGEGMMRKEEVARSQWSEGLVCKCAELQRAIIDNAVEMLAPGGYLIYSTCTFNTIEDEDNAAYVAGTCGLAPVDTGLAGSYGIRSQVKGNVPCLRFMPGFTRGEGLFVAVFKKDDIVSGEDFSANRNSRGGRRRSPDSGKGNQKIDKGLLSLAGSLLKEEMVIRQHGTRLLAMSEGVASLLERLPKDVRILSAGVAIGDVKGKDLIPAHQLALSSVFSRSYPEVELGEEDALRYLSRESIILPPGTPKGYVTATFDGYPLGFLKNIGNRSNNLYPAEYRIRALHSS